VSYAIVGAGKLGLALAGLFARKSISVSIASHRPPQAVATLVRELGATVTAVSLEEGVKADIVFLAIPFPALHEFARATAVDWRGKIVVDAMNAREDLGDRLSSNMVAEELGGARVVKAFNQLPAAVLGRDPSENGGRRVVFVSSNDDGASGIVQTLAKELGFSPIGLGKMSDGGRLLSFRGLLMLHNLVEQSL
jgi:8-hydroxy-5-deazaflavin:NADPH oxidoreductase